MCKNVYSHFLYTYKHYLYIATFRKKSNPESLFDLRGCCNVTLMYIIAGMPSSLQQL